MLTHPYLIEEHIRQREQELRGSARRYTPGQPHRRRRPAGRRPVRRRAGWVLIEIGLALVHGAVMPDTPPTAVRSSNTTFYAGNRPDSHPAKEA